MIETRPTLAKRLSARSGLVLSRWRGHSAIYTAAALLILGGTVGMLSLVCYALAALVLLWGTTCYLANFETRMSEITARKREDA